MLNLWVDRENARYAYEFAQGAVTKYYRPSGFSYRYLLFHNLEDWKTEIRVSAEFVPFEDHEGQPVDVFLLSLIVVESLACRSIVWTSVFTSACLPFPVFPLIYFYSLKVHTFI